MLHNMCCTGYVTALHQLTVLIPPAVYIGLTEDTWMTKGTSIQTESNTIYIMVSDTIDTAMVAGV